MLNALVRGLQSHMDVNFEAVEARAGYTASAITNPAITGRLLGGCSASLAPTQMEAAHNLGVSFPVEQRVTGSARCPMRQVTMAQLVQLTSSSCQVLHPPLSMTAWHIHSHQAQVRHHDIWRMHASIKHAKHQPCLACRCKARPHSTLYSKRSARWNPALWCS